MGVFVGGFFSFNRSDISDIRLIKDGDEMCSLLHRLKYNHKAATIKRRTWRNVPATSVRDIPLLPYAHVLLHLSLSLCHLRRHTDAGMQLVPALCLHGAGHPGAAATVSS